jgi:hypothetical protein
MADCPQCYSLMENPEHSHAPVHAMLRFQLINLHYYIVI